MKTIFRLKSLLEKIEEIIRKVYQSCLSIVKILVLSKFNIQLPVAVQEDCIVLGNGPSLKQSLQQNKDFFLNKSLFCVNMFPFSPEFTELKPQHLVWLDSGFYYHKNKEAMESLRPDVAKVINDLVSKTSWCLNLYLPMFAMKCSFLKEIEARNHKIKIIYFNYTIVKGFSFLEDFCFRKNLGMPACENVVASALFLALNNGYKTIYLAGVDHSWMKDVKVNQNNELMLNDRHFYTASDKVQYSRKVINPISSDSLNIVTFCKSQMKAFGAYYVIRNYADNLKVKIYNISNESYVDAFVRVRI